MKPLKIIFGNVDRKKYDFNFRMKYKKENYFLKIFNILFV